MNCPHCNVILVMSDKQGIEIDYCPRCRGVWLDRGELDKIIEGSTEIQSRPNFNPHNNIHDNHDCKRHSYDKHRRKGFLEELFD